MHTEKQISGLAELAVFIQKFLAEKEDSTEQNFVEFSAILRFAERENPWFTQENLRFCLKQWSDILNEENIKNWLKNYEVSNSPKKVGLILAGNIPIVGFHDIICVVLSGNIPLIKLSSKDKRILPYLLEKWNEFSGGNLQFEFVEKLKDFDAVVATGSNNTAQYLEYYFKNHLSIIRKNRTSIAVLSGEETDGELQKLAEDIFRYFGMGCRNVTRIFIPENFKIERLFENFLNFKDIINHHNYANNYDYNRAIYLLNQEIFWDNNFVMLKEDNALFSPLSVINFSKYSGIQEVEKFITENEKDIQCIVSRPDFIKNSVSFGEAQNPNLDTYADNVDTMKFLEVL